MLNKLLKYDLKWTFKPLVVFYILDLFLSIVIKIVESFNQTLFLLIIDKICSYMFIALAIATIVNCFMRNWVRFIHNIYKDESYLTHTLPVSKNKIYLSKVLSSIITLLTSLLVIIICISIMYLNKDSWQYIKVLFEQSAIYFNSSLSSLIIVFALIVFFEFLFVQMVGFLGIIIGHKSNNSKVIKSIISGFIIYMIFNSILILIYIIAGFISPDVMAIFKNLTVSSTVMKNLLLIGTIVYIIFNAIIYLIGNKLFNDGVNVD